MKKIITIIIIIILIIIGLRVAVILNYFFSLKDKDQRSVFVESINKKIEILNLEQCRQIDYYKFDEFNCLKTRSKGCILENMGMQTLKNLDNKLENAVTKCSQTYSK